jgi:hypothetical protein
VAGKKRRVFASPTWWKRLMRMSNEEMLRLLKILLAARAPTGEPFAATTTLGDLIDHFGERASLPKILRAPVLPEPDLPRAAIEQRITAEEPWTIHQIHWVRWFYVCEGFDLNQGWGGAFDYAAEVLVGSAAESGPDAMETSYKAIQRDLPPARRRPLTWRPRPLR